MDYQYPYVFAQSGPNPYVFAHSDPNPYVFAQSGPKHMMVKIWSGSSQATMININWDSHEHRRCIAACSVNGIYAMENDNDNRRRTGDGEALAPAWWQSFSFRLYKKLSCKCECMLCKIKNTPSSTLYGAILEHVPPAGALRRHPSAPRYIVAFRGTIGPRHLHQQHRFFSDMHTNLKLLVNKQNDCGRFRDAHGEVAGLLHSIAGDGSRATAAAVWLVGHSLGASIALSVGRDMAIINGWYLPAFLFNPPQVSLAPSMLPQALRRVARSVVYPTSHAVKAALGWTVMSPQKRVMETLFMKLEHWVPELYVHERDIICQGFIDYFEQRQKMLDWLGPVAKVAMKLSLRDMLMFIHSADDDPAENGEEHQRVRPHLLPCARLWKNSSYHNAHELQQWWKPDNELRLSYGQYSDRGAEVQRTYG